MCDSVAMLVASAAALYKAIESSTLTTVKVQDGFG